MRYETWFTDWSRFFETSNIKIVVERLYSCIVSTSSGKVSRKYYGLDEFYIKIFDIKTSSQLAFHGNSKFVDDVLFVSKTHDDYNTVIKSVFVLMK